MFFAVVFATLCSAVTPVSSPDIPVSLICVEAESGWVLSESNADLPRPPASMIKMMLMLLVAEGLEANTWTLETPIPVTARAAGIGGSQVYLKEGEVWSLDHMMRAVCVASANDAAMAVAEALWGSESAYLDAANRRAKALGMNETRINSVHGLPPGPGQEFDRTTARDMATLARCCVKKPILLEWARQKELQFRPGESIKYNTNKLLWRMAECDGLKTGYTRAAGFCVTVTAVKDGVRLIGVVMGEKQLQERFNTGQALLEGVFSELRRVPYLAKGQPVGPQVRVVNSPAEQVLLVSRDDINVAVRDKDRSRLTLVVQCPEKLRAPLYPGDEVGLGLVQIEGYTLAKIPLTVSSEVPEGGWRWKLARAALRQN